MAGNSETTKLKILSTATDEFATYGFAGARVDRIAANAECNKQLIYAYFGSKQGLFDAVAETHIKAVLDAVPIDATNLPEYAAKLFDYNYAHPQLIRLVEWYNLEGINSPTVVNLTNQSMAEKLEAIQEAQNTGAIKSKMPAEQLLALVLAISNTWSGNIHNLQAEDNDKTYKVQRKSIIEAIKRLVN